MLPKTLMMPKITFSAPSSLFVLDQHYFYLKLGEKGSHVRG